MGEFIARILNALTASLFRNAERLARLAAVRHVASEYEAAYAEATALEASGKTRLAEALRSELDEALSQGPAGHGADMVPLSLNGVGGGDPFALPGPSLSPTPTPTSTSKASAGSPEALAGAGEAVNGQPQPPQQRQRGRPRGRTTSGRKGKAKRTAKKAVTEAIDEGQTSPTLTGAST